MADWFVGPIMDKLINTCSEYLQDQFKRQTGTKKLERLRENHPKIQAVVSAASQAQMIDPDSALNKWIWQLRGVIDEADDVLDEFEYIKHEEQLATNMEETKKRFLGSLSLLVGNPLKLLRGSESPLKKDPNLVRLEEVVQKLDRVSAGVSNFLDLIEVAENKQKDQQDEMLKARETGSLPTTDLIGRGNEKEFVIQWLRKPPNEEHQSDVPGITLYNNISLLNIVGCGGMGKTTLL